MKSLKRNLLKAVVGAACVLPATKLSAQKINDIDVYDESLFGIGASYTIPTKINQYSLGAYIQMGFASEFKSQKNKFKGAVEIAGDIGVDGLHLKPREYIYGAGYMLKLGAGYDRGMIYAINNGGINLNKNGDIKLFTGYGAGASVNIGECLKINADFLIHNKNFLSREAQYGEKPNDNRYTVRVGLIHVIQRKSR